MDQIDKFHCGPQMIAGTAATVAPILNVTAPPGGGVAVRANAQLI
jgi:hypothetical protein